MSANDRQKPADMDPQAVVIKVRESGPYLVTGTVRLTDCEGTVYEVTGENIALCRCGGSATKPFCDGSHRYNGFLASERAVSPHTEN